MTFVCGPSSKQSRKITSRLITLLLRGKTADFSINGVRGDASGATHTIDEEVAEYNNDNNDEKEEVNHIEVRSETSL